VKKSGLLLLPYLNSQPLEDGAWLLLRLRRSSEYSGFREWFDVIKVFRFNVKGLVDDFGTGVITKEDALKRLKPSASGSETLFDEYSKLRTIIKNDGVLTGIQGSWYITNLLENLQEAQKAIESGQPKIFESALKETHLSLLKGNPEGAFQKNFGEHLDDVRSSRLEILPAKLKKIRSQQKIDVGALLKDAPSFKRTLNASLL
jgi:hypothetical protein